MREVTVIDAGVGNLGNLERAFESLGARVSIVSEAAAVADASRLVLPGVGAFRPPRERLRGELEKALRDSVERGVWLLGICVGYQLLFQRGEEFGVTDGLGLLPGRVSRLPERVPLPHIGWNRLHELAEHPLLEGIEEGAFTYFVHSFAPEDVPAEEILASCRHGRSFPAVAGRERVLGTQFHPEKSGEVGLRLLRNFLELD